MPYVDIRRPKRLCYLSKPACEPIGTIRELTRPHTRQRASTATAVAAGPRQQQSYPCRACGPGASRASSECGRGTAASSGEDGEAADRPQPRAAGGRASNLHAHPKPAGHRAATTRARSSQPGVQRAVDGTAKLLHPSESEQTGPAGARPDAPDQTGPAAAADTE